MENVILEPANNVPLGVKNSKSVEESIKVKDSVALVVAFADKTNVVAFVIESIVVPVVIPVPLTTIPGSKTEVSVSPVTISELLVIVPVCTKP